MVDLRWHTGTLVAIFLALGVGVLMGGAAVGNGALRARQRAVMRQIEAQFATLRQDQARLADARRFSAAALPWIVAGRLEGRTVAVVAMGRPAAAPEVRSALSLAGAGSYVVAVAGGLAPATAAGWASYGPGTRSRQLARAAVELARALFAGAGLSPLEADGAILAEGRPAPATAVVVLVGPDAGTLPVDLVLEALAADRPPGVPVVGAEQGEPRLTGLFTARGLAVVDDAQRASGRAALVLCLAGARGHYGLMPGAAGPLPAYGG